MKARFILLSAVLAASILAFGRPTFDLARAKLIGWQEASRTRAQRERLARIRALNELPAEELPTRPEDRERYPRGTFTITYVDDNGFGIDTASGTVSFDRISDPDTLIALRLTTAQLDSLYDEALDDRLFEMAQPGLIGSLWAGAQHWGGTLTLKAGGAEQSFRWDYWSLNEPWTDGHKRLDAFVRNLTRMVKTSPVYLAQPRPRGWYID